MNDTIPVPREMVEEVLGYGTSEEPRILGSHTYESVCDDLSPMVDLTLPQVGDIFRWAWQDASGGFDTDEMVEGADPIKYALDCWSSDADRLRNLLLWVTEHVDPIFKTQPSRVFKVVKEGRDCVVLRCKEGLGLKYATLERVAGSKVLGTKAHWVVRRLDWLLPQEGRDPSFVPATTEEEVREMCDCLTMLNAEIRRGVDS